MKVMTEAQKKRLEQMQREGWQRYYPGGYVLDVGEIFILKYTTPKRLRLERKKISVDGDLENV